MGNRRPTRSIREKERNATCLLLKRIDEGGRRGVSVRQIEVWIQKLARGRQKRRLYFGYRNSFERLLEMLAAEGVVSVTRSEEHSTMSSKSSSRRNLMK